MTIKRKRGRALQQERERFLRLQPLCVLCLAKDPPQLTRSRVLDHIIALTNGGSDADGNKQMLCIPCHDEKTARDMGYTQAERIGTDGYPIDSAAATRSAQDNH